MTRRAGVALGAIATALACLAATATAADEVRLTEATSTFPHRAYVLALPAGKRLQTSAVKVSENGHDVVDLVVVPAGAAVNTTSGTILAIDASKSMSGKPIAGAVAAARAFAARRNVNQRLGVETFNSSTDVAVPLTIDQAAIRSSGKDAAAPVQHAHVRRDRAGHRAVAGVRHRGWIDRRHVGWCRCRQLGDARASDQGRESSACPCLHHRSALEDVPARALQQLATATDGTFSSASSPTDLQRIYDQLGLQLAQEYVVEYNSKVKPGTPVKLDLSAAGIGNTTAAYVAPAVAGPSSIFHRSASDEVWQSWITTIFVALLVPSLARRRSSSRSGGGAP